MGIASKELGLFWDGQSLGQERLFIRMAFGMKARSRIGVAKEWVRCSAPPGSTRRATGRMTSSTERQRESTRRETSTRALGRAVVWKARVSQYMPTDGATKGNSNSTNSTDTESCFTKTALAMTGSGNAASRKERESSQIQKGLVSTEIGKTDVSGTERVW